MCRLLAYLGQPALLSEVVLWPDRSIIIQSFDARERKQDPSLPQHVGFGNLNGDGFGIGWFGDQGSDDRKPCVFTSVTPAWNNENLNRLSEKIVSPLMFAHVRAAYPGMPVSEQNCHPFQHNQYLWMHNGVIGGFAKVRRKLAAMLSDEAFDAVPSLSSSDSAMAFALFLHHLPNMHETLPSKTLLEAMEATIACICAVTKEAGATENSLLNFVMSDGATLIATRFSSIEGEPPASLYYAEGRSFEGVTSEEGVRQPEKKAPAGQIGQKEYAVKSGTTGSKLVMIASEPITKSCTDWVKVPPNSLLVVTREKGDYVNVLRSPISASGKHPLQAEIGLCLEAVQESRATGGMMWRQTAGGYGEQAASLRGRRALKRTGDSAARPSAAQQPPADVPPPLPDLSVVRSNAADLDSTVDKADHTLTGHRDAITCLLQHRGRLYSSSADCSIQVWDLADFQWIARLDGHKRVIVKMTVHGGHLFSIAGRTVRIWDLERLACIQIVYLGQPQMMVAGECSYRGGGSRTALLMPNCNFYFGFQDSNMSLFNCCQWLQDPSPQMAKEAEATSNRRPSPGSVSPPTMKDKAAAYKHGRAWAGSSERMCMEEHALNAKSVTSTADDAFESISQGRVKAHLGPINDMVCIRDCLCSCGGDAMIRLADLKTLEPKGNLRGHRGSVLCLASCNDLLLSGGRDNAIRIWDMDTKSCRRTLQGHKHDVLRIVTLEVAPTVCDTASPETGLYRAGSGFAGLAAPQSSRFRSSKQPPFLFASASADGTARLWSGKLWVCLRVFSPAGLRLPWLGSPTGAILSPRQSISGASSLSHNPLTCITCAPGISINQATQLLKGHLKRGSSLANHVVESSLNALNGLVLNKDHLIVGNLAGAIHLYSISDLYNQCRAGTGECSSPGTPDSDAPGNEADAYGTTEEFRKRNLPDSDIEALLERVNSGELQSISPNKRRKLRPQARMSAQLLEMLRDFIAIESVSSDPQLTDECFRAAKFVAEHLEILGAEVKMTQLVEGKNPVVIGRLGRNPNVPTVTFYGHYDVQPGMEDDWRTDPFEMVSIDGYLYGRGTTDNKGPILSIIFAVKELLEDCSHAGKELPVNCAFCFEGEEENGSHGFAATLEANKHWFEGTKAIVVSNNLWIGETQPCLTYGMRGLIAMDVCIAGPQRDLHSGNDGGVFNEPMVDLVNVIGTLVDGRNNILVPGFSDGIKEHRLERVMLDAVVNSNEFSLSSYREHLGVPGLTEQRSASDLLYSRWLTPTISVVDVRTGETANDRPADNGGFFRFGPSRFSVIPRNAVGKISIRFVPKQQPDHLISSIKNHLHHEFAKLRSMNSLTVTVRNVGDWWESDTSSKLFQVAERAIEREWNMKPLHVREGGTMPMVATLEKILNAQAIMIPLGQSSDNPHLANERIRGINLIRGKNVMRHFLEEAAAAFSSSC